jgi:hypothetical protein
MRCEGFLPALGTLPQHSSHTADTAVTHALLTMICYERRFVTRTQHARSTVNTTKLTHAGTLPHKGVCALHVCVTVGISGQPRGIAAQSDTRAAVSIIGHGMVMHRAGSQQRTACSCPLDLLSCSCISNSVAAQQCPLCCVPLIYDCLARELASSLS